MVCLAASLGVAGACSSQGDTGARDSTTPRVPSSPAGGAEPGVVPGSSVPVPVRSSEPRENETGLVERLPSLRAAGHPSPRLSTALRSKAWREVALLQMALNVVNGPGLKVDGHYDLSTLYAVIRFQQASGIRVTGIVGPATLRALAQALSEPGGAVPGPR